MSAAHPLRAARAAMLEHLQHNVPHELRELRAWVLFKLVPKDGRPGEWDKVPHYVNGEKRRGRQGSPEDAEHLADFAAAMQALTAPGGAEFDGVGLAVLPCHPVTALDLDKLAGDPERRELAAAVLASGTYVETSPSGNGQRALFAGKAGFGNVKNHAAGVEVFESAGFVTVTGAELSDGAELEPMPDTLRARLAALLSKPKNRPAPKGRPVLGRFDLNTLPPELAPRIVAGFPPGTTDRSAYLYWRAFDLRRAGLSEREALEVLGDPDLPWIVPALERRGGDIESARDWLWHYVVHPAYAQPLEVSGGATETAQPNRGAWPEPLDVLRQMVAPAFDADDVPPELARFACEWARAAGFDASGVIAATVGAAAASLSDGLRLEVNAASRHYESARLWVLLIGPPGVAKSPSLAQACEPLKEMHRELLEEWQAECARLRAVAERSEEVPQLPPRPALYVTDATTEALAETLAGNPRGLLTIYDELDSWLGSHDAYRSGGSKDRGEWLRAYDGGPHTVERIKRGAFYVPNWGISILAATTPSALQRHARKLPADGLLQRFIPVLVQPGGQADRRADVSLTAQAYYNVLVRLYQYGPGSGVRLVRMTAEASDLLHAERERLRSLALAVQVYGDGFAGHVAKHAAMLARIALTFHAVTGRDHPAERLLEAGSVRLASRFMQKALRHAQALYADLLGHDSAVSLARAVAAVLLADRRQEVTRRELVHSCHAWRHADDRQRDDAARFLVDVGWLREEHGEYIKPHVTRWTVNPAVHERFAEHGQRHRERRRLVLEAIRGADR